MMKSNIYRTAAQVTVFSTIEKALSFFYRIVLSRIIGAEGLGIYQISLSVFAVFLTVASSGVPITVSRLMTKYNAEGNNKNKNAVVTAGVVSTLIFTVPAFLLLFFGRNWFGFLFSDERCLNVFIILIPGLVITSIYSVMRGAFWGNKQFMPYSLIELAEDALMVVLGCIFIMSATSATAGAESAAWAVLISYVFSFVVSVGWYLIKGGRFTNPLPQLRPVLSSSLPITAMRTSTSLLNSLVAVLLPVLLVNSYGYTSAEAMAIYGIALGMAVPILFIPSSLIGSIAVVIAPELSENFYKNKTDRLRSDVEKSIRAGTFIATIIIPVLFVLGTDIGEFLYSDKMSGEIIRNCSFVLLPMCLSMITTTVLNSMNCEMKTLIYFFIGAAAMLICIFALTPYLGVYSYMIGMSLSFVVTAFCNLRLLKKKCDGINYAGYIVRSFAICLACCVFGSLLRGIVCSFMNLFWTIAVCGVALVLFTAGFLYLFEMVSLKPVKKLISGK